MRWHAAVLLALVALVTPAVSEAAGEQILILGGGKTAADAQAWQQRWQAIESLLRDFIILPEGYPQVVESKDVPGLNPGFHIVVLGYCDEDALAPRLQLLKAVYPGAYSKTVTRPVPGKCPALVNEATLDASQSFKKDGQRVVGLIVSQTEKVKDETQESSSLRVLLFDAQDTLQSFERDGQGPTDGIFPQSCTLTLEGSKSRFVVGTSCTIDAPSCTGHISSFEDRDIYTVDGGKILVTSKRLKETTAEYCD